jgi:surface antigen
MHPYTVKNWLWVVIGLLSLFVAFAVNANTMCNFKEQTVITADEDRQVLSKHRIDTCVDNTVPKVKYGLAPNCGISGKYDPNFPSEAISCQLDDGTWRQYNTFYQMDQFSKKRDLHNFPQPNFANYNTGRSVGVILEDIIAWTKQLNEEQRELHLAAIRSALEKSTNGQGFRWVNANAGGTATIVATLQTSQGYCKIVHTSVYSGSRQVADSGQACYNNSTNYWQWINDKY